VIVWAGLAALLISPAIGVFRSAAGSQRLDAQVWLRAFNHVGNPVVSTVSEMGQTMEITGYIFFLVPSRHAYDWGSGYLGSLSSVFPNFFWNIHPGHIYVYSDWLDQNVIPLGYNQGIGLGFSYVAEAYINFGPLLAPLMVIIIGFLYARLSVWGSRATDPARWAATASVCFGCSEWGRYQAFNVFRAFFWYALGPYLLILLLRYLYCRIHLAGQLVGYTGSSSSGTPLQASDTARPTILPAEAASANRPPLRSHVAASESGDG